MSEPLKAVVRDGRIVVEGSTDLAEGTELQLVVVEDTDDYSDVDFAEPWMDEEEAKAFNEEMRASLADIDAGRVVDADVVLAELRARAQAS